MAYPVATVSSLFLSSPDIRPAEKRFVDEDSATNWVVRGRPAPHRFRAGGVRGRRRGGYGGGELGHGRLALGGAAGRGALGSEVLFARGLRLPSGSNRPMGDIQRVVPSMRRAFAPLLSPISV